MSAPDDLTRNRAVWTKANTEYTDSSALEQWSREDISWGMWGVADAEVGALPDVKGLDVVELGCGTAYLSAWLARRGARVVGVDPTPAQLDTARRMQAEFGLTFPLVEAGAEDVPLPDAAFDLAVSEYGASLWADPDRWIAEAARLLRPGGLLVFLTNSAVSILCSPDDGGKITELLVRPQFGMRRFDSWDGVEFHLAHGDWIRLLRAHGFEVEALFELQAPADAEDHPYYDFVTAGWARKWPSEEIWRARKRA